MVVRAVELTQEQVASFHADGACVVCTPCSARAVFVHPWRSTAHPLSVQCSSQALPLVDRVARTPDGSHVCGRLPGAVGVRLARPCEL